MAATVYSVAANLYHYAKDNASRVNEIRAAFDSCVSGGALSRGGLDSVTSATKNGVTMQKMIGLDEDKRASALRLALQYLEAGMITPASRALGRF